LVPSIVIGPAPPIVLERLDEELLIASVLFDEVPGPGALALPDGAADCPPGAVLLCAMAAADAAASTTLSVQRRYEGWFIDRSCGLV
jgi:hypothetical protein